ncbi:MAG: hypothetical protein ACE5I3_00535 [Phycisphaerae bacterium]
MRPDVWLGLGSRAGLRADIGRFPRRSRRPLSFCRAQGLAKRLAILLELCGGALPRDLPTKRATRMLDVAFSVIDYVCRPRRYERRNRPCMPLFVTTNALAELVRFTPRRRQGRTVRRGKQHASHAVADQSGISDGKQVDLHGKTST